ncbi:hypothetical protein L1F30_05120 [Simiduia sp. 21SJ11W-1]|uniref:hypothetical protein n=1 Tax=Simiduia sp. 21SJ11W-1 TaxID=2909669 RepID=UPI00209F8E6E|nr:hypothetical protein [Simiduia sp. 21SJ11W-1]UTA48928.1 hypothetical protein L1F30_05120 [Simiduia sp. 21SJ11W-1]
MQDPNIPIMWYAYLAGVLGLMIATWWMFRQRSELAQFATVTVGAWLLTPVALTPEIPQWAPAFFVLVLDGLFTDHSIERVIWPMAFVWVAALLLSLAARIAWQKWRGKAGAPKAEEH